MNDSRSVFNNTTMPPGEPLNPAEAALQSLCKQIVKSRLFRGFYEERRFVESVQGYRDIVSLHKSERELSKLLKDVAGKLQLFYSQQKPYMWLGLTAGPLVGSSANSNALDTFIWAEIEDLAFGQYWFSIKSIRFRDNEIILKLKIVRSVEAEEMSEKWSKQSVKTSSAQQMNSGEIPASSSSAGDSNSPAQAQQSESTVDWQDFQQICQQWWISIKQTVYDFMAQDISKENIKGLLRFMGLLLISIISGAFMACKWLGQFTIRFLFEFSRLTRTMTPIIMKMFEVVEKIIGGFYILLAMIWKDTVGKGNKPMQPALEYNRPMYKSIKYDIRQRQAKATPMEAAASGSGVQ